jgi:hypothetical protein
MSKNLIQDMVKVKKNKVEKKLDVKDTKLEKKLEKESNIDSKFNSLYNSIKKETEERKEREEHNGGSKYGLWIVALVAIVFLFVAVSFLFSGAKITINPKTIDLALNDGFVASKDSSTDNLPFDLVVIPGEETKEIQGGEEKDVNDSAKGTVILYNAFNNTAQKLSINTRLEGSNGKIYKTKTAVNIPAMNADGTPGSFEAEVYGSVAGAEYNTSPIDFTIFGFKGTTKYSKIYARSKGDITGGFVGKARQVSEADKANAIVALKESLQNKLFKKASDQIPSGYILFKDSVFVQTDAGTAGNSLESGMVPMTLKGTLYGFLFDEKKLTKRIVQNNIEKYKDDDVYIPNLKDFIFTLDNKENISFADVKEINFNLSGTSKIVWNIDSEKLISDVLGKDKKDFNQILTQYPGIDSAEVVVKPVWRKTFPDKLKDIKVIINQPQ